jgi:hypothetical protein
MIGGGRIWAAWGRVGFGWLPLVTALAACGTSEPCRPIGCSDYLTIVVRRSDAAPPDYPVALVVDGKEAMCPAFSAVAAPGATHAHFRCGDLAQGDVDVIFQSVPAAYEELITFSDTPSEVKLALGTDPTLQRTVHPEYESVRPAGPECDPVCRGATEVWVLP